MTDKEKFRKEVEKLKSNLIYGACSSQIAMETMCKEEAYNEVLAILDTMQEEPVSIWHDASEEPKPNMELICVGQYGNPLVLSSNSDSFKSRDISKWVYFNDLLNLFNVQRTGKNWKESVSNPTPNEKMSVERWKKACEAACCDSNYRSHYGLTETRDDYFVDGVQWADEHHKEEPVSEELEEAAEMFIDSFIPTEVDTVTPFSAEYVIGLLNKAIEFGAKWQKEQMMAKAIEGGCFSYKNGVVHISCDIDEHLTDIKMGDKVKVIVIKEG